MYEMRYTNNAALPFFSSPMTCNRIRLEKAEQHNSLVWFSIKKKQQSAWLSHVRTTSSRQHCAAFFNSFHTCSSATWMQRGRLKNKTQCQLGKTTHHVSWLLNFLVTTFPSSRPKRSAIFWDRSGWELPLNILIFGILLRSRVSFSPSGQVVQPEMSIPLRQRLQINPQSTSYTL